MAVELEFDQAKFEWRAIALLVEPVGDPLDANMNSVRSNQQQDFTTAEMPLKCFFKIFGQGAGAVLFGRLTDDTISDAFTTSKSGALAAPDT